MSAAKPKRIQRKRTKGWKMPPNTVYVGRPTNWGNPFAMALFKGDAQKAMEAYRKYVETFPQIAEAAKRDLRGKDLACWCKEGAPCHADILLEIANASPARELAIKLGNKFRERGQMQRR